MTSRSCTSSITWRSSRPSCAVISNRLCAYASRSALALAFGRPCIIRVHAFNHCFTLHHHVAQPTCSATPFNALSCTSPVLAGACMQPQHPQAARSCHQNWPATAVSYKLLPRASSGAVQATVGGVQSTHGCASSAAVLAGHPHRPAACLGRAGCSGIRHSSCEQGTDGASAGRIGCACSNECSTLLWMQVHHTGLSTHASTHPDPFISHLTLTLPCCGSRPVVWLSCCRSAASNRRNSKGLCAPSATRQRV
jgi:hypothetical protein